MSVPAEQITHRPKLLEKLGDRFSIDPAKMLPTLKATAFKTANNITDEQMVALLVVADQYQLNPWTREIYAFPDKRGGIVPVVGLDGWSRIINTDSKFDGMDYEFSQTMVEGEDHKPCPEWVLCRIHRKDRSHPIEVTEYFDECYRPPSNGRNGKVMGPWQSHPKRFLRHKATIQCARLAFGFVGIFDQDEAERIVEGEVVPMPRSTSVVRNVIENEGITVDEQRADEYADQLKDGVFNQDDFAIKELLEEMDNDMRIVVETKLKSVDRSYIRNMGKEDEPSTTEQ